jgi:hypothetical protein
MTIEQPTFPTPEDELLASQLYQAMRKLVDGEKAGPATEAPDIDEPAEARVTKG